MEISKHRQERGEGKGLLVFFKIDLSKQREVGRKWRISSYLLLVLYEENVSYCHQEPKQQPSISEYRSSKTKANMRKMKNLFFFFFFKLLLLQTTEAIDMTRPKDIFRLQNIEPWEWIQAMLHSNNELNLKKVSRCVLSPPWYTTHVPTLKTKPNKISKYIKGL